MQMRHDIEADRTSNQGKKRPRGRKASESAQQQQTTWRHLRSRKSATLGAFTARQAARQGSPLVVSTVS
jgi:hypothetical protein